MNAPSSTRPGEPQGPAGFSGHLQTLSWRDPTRWLALGWRDFVRCPGIGLFYGACFTGMGWALMKVYEAAPAYVLALSAGFLMMGPFLCLGLYQASRRLERGERATLMDSLTAWRERMGELRERFNACG